MWKFTKEFTLGLSLTFFCSNCLWINADCCTNELEFRICANCEKTSKKFANHLKKKFNVYYQRLLTFFKILFIINAFINVCCHFFTFNKSTYVCGIISHYCVHCCEFLWENVLLLIFFTSCANQRFCFYWWLTRDFSLWLTANDNITMVIHWM